MKEDQTLETGLGTDCQFSSTIGLVRIALFLDRTIGNQSVARTNLPLRLQCVPCYFSITYVNNHLEKIYQKRADCAGSSVSHPQLVTGVM